MGILPPHELRRLQIVAKSDSSLDELVERRLGGEPLQYIEGTATFGPIEIKVDERVLIPRPETEGILEVAQKMVRNPTVIVDLCTGSGALALALKHYFRAASVFATEISNAAIELARDNKTLTGMEATFLEGDLFDPLPVAILGQVDLIVSNPPYVAEHEYEYLPRDVRREPRQALVAGQTGLEMIERIGASAAEWLRPGGVVICEIGATQGVSAPSSFVGVSTVVRQDLSGRDRYVVGVKP